MCIVSLCQRAGPFGYNQEVEIRIDFSLPVTVPEVEETASTSTTTTATAATIDELSQPVLSVVIGSTSTARTTTYLTAAAVYATQDVSSTDATSSALANASLHNDSSVFLTYLVAADDESVDLRYR